MHVWPSSRRFILLAALLASQALTACIVVPVPPRPRAVVVDVHPGYGPEPYQGTYRRHHHDHWRD